jgi:hypothetical protein
MRGLLRDYESRQAKRDKALDAMHPSAMERAGYWFRDVSVPLPEPAQAVSCPEIMRRNRSWHRQVRAVPAASFSPRQVWIL